MRPTAVTTDWADGKHVFDLPLGQLREHDDLCKAGPGVVLGRLRDQTFRIYDVRETIRLGLIGGGLKPVDALKLVDRYVDQRPLAENVPLAILILASLMYGAPEEALENPQTAPETGQDASTSPPSTATEPSSASMPEPLTA